MQIVITHRDAEGSRIDWQIVQAQRGIESLDAAVAGYCAAHSLETAGEMRSDLGGRCIALADGGEVDAAEDHE